MCMCVCVYSCTGGTLIFNTNSLTIPEGGSSTALCVQLIAGAGNPTALAADLIVPLSFALGGAGIMIH